MGRFNNYIAVTIASVFAMSSVGCGQAFRATGSGGTTAASTGNSGQSVNIDDQMAKAQAASDEAEKAMVDANAALADIMNADGSIKLNLFSSSSVNSQTHTVGLLSPIVDKLNGVFDEVFAKVDLVKAQFAKARLALADAMAKVEAAGGTPAQLELIRQQMAKIDALEGKFTSAMHKLAGKLDLAVAAIDKVVNSLTNMIPGFGSIAGLLIDTYLLGDVKDLIGNIQARLLAL